jgi:signal transduction histidine kinase
MPDRKMTPARDAMNAHLRSERKKTDAALDATGKTGERKAEAVVRAARSQAADVLRAGRQRADKISRRSKLSSADQTAIGDERARQDEIVRQEYARADELTAAEREERRRLLLSLLDVARRDTNTGLLLERVTADELLGQGDHFLGMVSHDLHNELACIAMSVAHIIKHASHDDAGGEIFRSATNVQRTAQRMSRLIGDLLDVASMRAGRFMIASEDHDVRQVVADAVESFQSIASAKGISLVGETMAEATIVRCDQQRILQVLGNLLTNALKFTPQGGRVCVRVERGQGGDKGEICLSVSDTGPGIAANRLEAIFERYQQGARGPRKGLGLGLYIAKRIVEAHSGRIWAERCEGGATLKFTLPAPRTVTAVRPRSSDARRSASGRQGRAPRG